ncbi:DapH/DapD/GlmU-related protein [uncultured Aquabacterium sp.]|uniref:acyltransferase n=1 Tax=Aquabacterium sp. TaxID=1872578 RepID=UPI0025F45942|nr:DapH/DapD/GlmU-related protein [uncultured Aquabacterium sp.]
MSYTGSIISESASIGHNVRIGRFCIVEDGVSLADDVILEDYAMVLAGSRIGPRTRIGTYTKVGKSVVIGSDCSFTSFCEIRDRCKLGDRVLMGSRGTLSAGTVVEDDVVMKYAFVVTDTPDLQKNDEKIVGHLKRGSRFGASVVIMPGVTVGVNAEIGACSQVRKNVPDNEVWFGIPAKFYRTTQLGNTDAQVPLPVMIGQAMQQHQHETGQVQ